MRHAHLRFVIAPVIVGLALAGCAATPAQDGVVRDFAAVTTAGDEVSSASIRGQVTILDFWAVF